MADVIDESMSRDDFNVGWICALPKELQASRAVLDTVYPDDVHPAREEGDSNAYVWGTIAGHNVVMAACSPEYGNTSAANTADHMRNAYRNIRIMLLVGIGGGVPSKNHDVRLGDIVVSSPDGRHGGVVQHDLGKVRSDGSFTSVGSLRQAPRFIQSVVTRMKTIPESHGQSVNASIEDALSGMFERNSSMHEHFSRPAVENRSQLSKNERFTEKSLNSQNDQQHLGKEQRIEGQPFIHYGLIASGNTVVKSKEHRDEVRERLHDDYGSQPLCYEMEAAGVMKEWECLVIRGISDYCDEHKDDIWQNYASAVAASYAKVLLNNISLDEIGKERSISNASAPNLNDETRRSIAKERNESAIDEDSKDVLNKIEEDSMQEDGKRLTKNNSRDTAEETGQDTAERSDGNFVEATNQEVDLASCRPNFVFEFRSPKRKASRGSISDTPNDTSSMSSDPEYPSQLTAYGISMKAFKTALPTQLPNALDVEELSLVLPIFDCEGMEVELNIQDWAFDKGIKFDKQKTPDLVGSVYSRKGPEASMPKTIPLKVEVRIMNLDNKKSKGLEKSEAAVAVACFNLGGERGALRKKCIEWRENVKQFFGQEPLLILLGLANANKEVRPPKNGRTSACILPRDECIAAAREVEALLYIEVAKNNFVAMDILFNTLIGCATAALSGPEN